MMEYIKNSHTRGILYKYLVKEKIDKDSAQRFVEPVPKTLFRYSDLNTYSCYDIINNQITLTKPMFFNDIYDSTIHRHSYPQIEERIRKINELMQKNGYPAIDMNMEYIKKDFDSRDRHYMTYMTEPMRIGCFSEVENSILMWSHYANKNQGICVEYDFTSSKHESSLYPVIYLNNPIDMSSSLTNKEDGNIEKLVLLSTLIKSEEWAYEKEWRYISYWITPNPLPDRIPIINIPTPVRIYLGKNFLRFWINKGADKTFNDFCDYIEKNKIQIQIMQNELLSYKLIPHNIDISLLRRLNESELYDKYLV